MDSETLALAAEVAAALDNNSMASESSLLTPITLYRTGRILFATTCILHPSSSHDANNDTSSSSISTVFDKLLSSIDRDYVRNVLLHELHVAYANLIVSFASSSIRDTTSSLTSLMASTKSNYATKPLAECTAQDVIEATESLCGMYLSSITACRYCGSFQTNGDSDDDGSVNELDIVYASFSWVYQYIILDNMLDNTTSSSLDRLKEGLLKTISRILIHGIVVCQSTTSTSSEQESEDERLSNVVNVIQRIQSSGGGEYSYTMGDMLHLEEQKHHNDSFLQALNEQFNDGPQLQYFKVMLHGFLRSKPPEPTISSTKTNNPSNKMLLEPSVKQPPQTMLDVQINHIQSVLPDLGEGYIEEALKCYNHNIERTLDALLSGNNTIHPALSTLPKNLPRKLKDLPEQYTPNVNMHRGATFKDDGKEHVDRQKQYIKEAERKAEEEAYLVENVSRALGGLRVQGIQNNEVATTTITTDDFGITGNEYNDDYDDQYDGVGDDGGMAGGIGGLDEGLYDVDVHNVHQRYDRGGAKNDQDMWRQYNKLIKEVDSESQYWEESRNLNRQNNHKPNNKEQSKEDMYDDDDGDKKYRGPDKGRGGRLIGPDGKYLPIQRGGKKGRGNTTNPPNNGGAGRGGRGRGGGRGAGKAKATNDDAQEGQKKDGDDLSKIQKRRKNDNKAKIGNHHRKDRATKKATGGMMH